MFFFVAILWRQRSLCHVIKLCPRKTNLPRKKQNNPATLNYGAWFRTFFYYTTGPGRSETSRLFPSLTVYPPPINRSSYIHTLSRRYRLHFKKTLLWKVLENVGIIMIFCAFIREDLGPTETTLHGMGIYRFCSLLSPWIYNHVKKTTRKKTVKMTFIFCITSLFFYFFLLPFDKYIKQPQRHPVILI